MRVPSLCSWLFLFLTCVHFFLNLMKVTRDTHEWTWVFFLNSFRVTQDTPCVQCNLSYLKKKWGYSGYTGHTQVTWDTRCRVTWVLGYPGHKKVTREPEKCQLGLPGTSNCVCVCVCKYSIWTRGGRHHKALMNPKHQIHS